MNDRERLEELEARAQYQELKDRAEENSEVKEKRLPRNAVDPDVIDYPDTLDRLVDPKRWKAMLLGKDLNAKDPRYQAYNKELDRVRTIPQMLTPGGSSQALAAWLTGSAARRIGSGATIGAAEGAINTPKEGESRLGNSGYGAAAGLAVGAGGETLAGLLNAGGAFLRSGALGKTLAGLAGNSPKAHAERMREMSHDVTRDPHTLEKIYTPKKVQFNPNEYFGQDAEVDNFIKGELQSGPVTSNPRPPLTPTVETPAKSHMPFQGNKLTPNGPQPKQPGGRLHFQDSELIPDPSNANLPKPNDPVRFEDTKLTNKGSRDVYDDFGERIPDVPKHNLEPNPTLIDPKEYDRLAELFDRPPREVPSPKYTSQPKTTTIDPQTHANLREKFDMPRQEHVPGNYKLETEVQQIPVRDHQQLSEKYGIQQPQEFPTSPGAQPELVPPTSSELEQYNHAVLGKYPDNASMNADKFNELRKLIAGKVRYEMVPARYGHRPKATNPELEALSAKTIAKQHSSSPEMDKHLTETAANLADMHSLKQGFKEAQTGDPMAITKLMTKLGIIPSAGAIRSLTSSPGLSNNQSLLQMLEELQDKTSKK